MSAASSSSSRKASWARVRSPNISQTPPCDAPARAFQWARRPASPVPLPIRINGVSAVGPWKLRLTRMRMATTSPGARSRVSQPEARPGVPSAAIMRRTMNSARPSRGREATEYSRLAGAPASARGGRPISAMSPATQTGAWSTGSKASSQTSPPGLPGFRCVRSTSRQRSSAGGVQSAGMADRVRTASWCCQWRRAPVSPSSTSTRSNRGSAPVRFSHASSATPKPQNAV